MSLKHGSIYMILAITLMATISATSLNHLLSSYSVESGTSGRIIVPAYAMEIQTLEKEINQCVQFKVKVKNTGNVEATYIIVAKWREHGSDEWESDGIADVRLSPGQAEILVVGSIECTDTMIGRYFDVKFILYDHETETILDEKVIERAWHVNEILVTGAIINFWIE